MPDIKITPKIIHLEHHKIDLSKISKSIIQIIEKLHQAKHEAYIVGGGVRDLLLGFKPKDFDVVTDATPDEVRAMFKNSRIIGRRFRLVHIYFGREIIEVATFRAAPTALTNHTDDENVFNHAHLAIDGQIIRDNIYGTLEEDIWRRDFTINALYLDPTNGNIVDYCGGYADLLNKKIHVLGDPAVRYREDPVRLLRALRFAAKLDFEIELKTDLPLKDHHYHNLLDNIPPARLFEEYNKLFLTGYSAKSFTILKKYHLFNKLFPLTSTNAIDKEFPNNLDFLYKVLQNTDKRKNDDLPINPAFLLAAFLWYPLQYQQRQMQGEKHSREQIWRLATHKIFKAQNGHLAIPKRYTKVIDDIWYLQRLFNKVQPKSVIKAATHPKFRAGFDFLLLRSEFENINHKQLKWWQQYEAADSHTRSKMLDSYAECF